DSLAKWILSNMESDKTASGMAALSDAERARDELAAGVEFPRGHDLAIGGAVSVQIAATAVGLAVEEAWGLWVLTGGCLLFGLVAGLQLWRFARRIGVRVSGL